MLDVPGRNPASSAQLTDRMPHWMWPWLAYAFLLPSETWLNQIKLDWVLLAFGLIASLSLALGSPRRGQGSGRHIAVLALLIAMNASYFLSVDRDLTWLGLLRVWINALTYFLATSALLSRQQVTVTLRAFGYGGGAAALNILLSALAGEVQASSLRFTMGLLGAQTDPNFVVVELLLPFAAALEMARKRPQGHRLPGYSLAGLIGGAAILTESRGGTLGLLAVAFTFLLLRGRWKTSVIALTALLALYAGFAPHLGRFDLSRDPTGADRTIIWKADLQEGMRRWPTGVGLHASRRITPTLSGLDMARDPHSTYVQAFVETGLAGLIALLWVLGAHLGFVRRGRSERAIVAGLLGVMVAGVFLHVLINQFLWAIWALSAQAADRNRLRRSPIASSLIGLLTPAVLAPQEAEIQEREPS